MAHSHVHVPDFTNTKFCNSSIRGRYGDAVQEVDNVIGSIYAAVQKAGIADNTLTFFTADNGPWLQLNLAGGSAGLFYMGKFTTWEGGMRQPAFVHWPGRIAPSSRSAEIVSTMDIFMTMLNISDAMKYLPNDDRVYDGKDMSDIIFNRNGGRSKHECYGMYGGSINDTQHCPFKPGDPKYVVCSGMWAIRCDVPNYSGSYKAHWVTRFTNGTISVQDPPLLFNIEWDPSEMHPIRKSNSNYQHIINYLSKKREASLNSVKKGIKNQMLEGQNTDYEICAAPNSKQKYPNYPNCTLTTEGFTGFTCDPVCYDTDQCGSEGPPVGPDEGTKYEFGSMTSDDPVFHINYDNFNDQGITVTINYN
eukprot:431655_1